MPKSKIFAQPWLQRVIVSTLSLFGIFQTALIVGVLSDALVIPPEEKRILASLEKLRLDKIRRNTAASLIQWAWPGLGKNILFEILFAKNKFAKNKFQTSENFLSNPGIACVCV